MSQVEVFCPSVVTSEDDEEILIEEWHVAEGDQIEADKPLLNVETQKVNIEIPAPDSGIVIFLSPKKPQDSVRVGELLAIIETGTEQPDNELSKAHEEHVAHEERSNRVVSLVWDWFYLASLAILLFLIGEKVFNQIRSSHVQVDTVVAFSFLLILALWHFVSRLFFRKKS